MLHVPFHHQSELLCGNTTFTAAYANFLQSGSIPLSLEDDIHKMMTLKKVDLQHHTLLDMQYYALLYTNLYITLFYVSVSE